MIGQALARTRRLVVAVWHCPTILACWIRGGYPQWAPRSGHLTLVALCGQDGSLIEQKPYLSN